MALTAFTLTTLVVGTTESAAQSPPEPWSFRAQIEANPSLRSALDELFALAAAKDAAAFRQRFTSNTIRRLEAGWAESRPPNGSWATMMSSLVARDGSPPEIVRVSLDDLKAPREATAVISMDGRQHTLYLQNDPKQTHPWRVRVRDLSAGFFDLDSLNLSIDLASDERSFMELSFGTGLGVPGEQLFRFGDGVDPAINSSLWIMVEFFASPWLRLGAIYDLPLSGGDQRRWSPLWCRVPFLIASRSATVAYSAP